MKPHWHALQKTPGQIEMFAQDPLEGHHALVTGAGSGIGAAIARRLAEAGARVTLAGRRGAPLAAVASTLPVGRAHAVPDFDVTDSASISAGFANARARFGPLSILINNAGEAPSARFDKTDAAMWAHVLAVNLTGVFNVTRTALADLRARGAGARIITIASTAGLRGYSYVSAYCAAKHGVIGLTRSLSLELATSGVTVNAVCPGFTETPLLERAVSAVVAASGRSADEVQAELRRSNPQGRLVTPQEVADTVLWLASPGASAMTGQAIAVAGGEVMA